MAATTRARIPFLSAVKLLRYVGVVFFVPSWIKRKREAEASPLYRHFIVDLAHANVLRELVSVAKTGLGRRYAVTVWISVGLQRVTFAAFPVCFQQDEVTRHVFDTVSATDRTGWKWKGNLGTTTGSPSSNGLHRGNHTPILVHPFLTFCNIFRLIASRCGLKCPARVKRSSEMLLLKVSVKSQAIWMADHHFFLSSCSVCALRFRAQTDRRHWKRLVN